MVVTKLETSSNFTMIKHTTSKFEWRLDNYNTTNYSESFEVSNDTKMFFELRSNVYDNYRNYYIVPLFRFESANNADHKVAVSIASKVGGASYKGELLAMNKDFPAASPSLNFMSQQYYASFCENGSLTLLIEVRTEFKLPSSDLGENLLEQKGKIVKDLNAFIGEKNTSDFTYRVDDQDFYVHKMMLSARSPVFFKMFATDYKTSDQGIMNEISKDAFKDFLRFIYTGGVDNLKQHSLELLKIADKYEVDDLKSLCELHLMTNLTESDAVDLFTCAHKYRCNADLKKASFEFIKNSFAKFNVVLPDEFVDAPIALNKAIMMKNNFESFVKVEVAQAEKINSIKTAENTEN